MVMKTETMTDMVNEAVLLLLMVEFVVVMIAIKFVCWWLFNPLSINVSTRGNAEALVALEADINNGNFASIAPADDPKYALRPLGLMANGFMASENTGTTNELLLARWYINEIYLRISDMKNATSKDSLSMSSFCFMAKKA